MNKEDKSKAEIEALHQRFEVLFSDSSLSEEEKNILSQEMLKVIYGSEEVVQ